MTAIQTSAMMGAIARALMRAAATVHDPPARLIVRERCACSADARVDASDVNGASVICSLICVLRLGASVKVNFVYKLACLIAQFGDLIEADIVRCELTPGLHNG